MEKLERSCSFRIASIEMEMAINHSTPRTVKGVPKAAKLVASAKNSAMVKTAMTGW
ncbi:hypothetical protein [Haliea sp.]